jgi:hypothetical protein
MAERKQAVIAVLLQVRCGRIRENHTVYFYIAKKNAVCVAVGL